MITSITYLSIYTLGIFAALIASGSWALYVYQLVYFLNPESRWWGAQIPAIPYSLITVVVMVLACISQKRDPLVGTVRQTSPLKWMIAVGVFHLAVSIFALNPDLHQRMLIDFWKLIATMLVAFLLLDSVRKLEFAFLAYIFGAFYIGWEAYTKGRNGWGRVEGIGMVDAPDANGFSAALVPAIPLLIWFFWQGTKWQKVAACASGIWIANGIVLINSRGSFLGVVVGVSWLLGTMLLSRHQKGKQRFVAILIIAMSASATLYVTDELFWKRMSTLQEVDDKAKSGSSRTEMWMAAVDMAKAHPAGIGSFGFQELSRFYIDPSLFFQSEKNKKLGKVPRKAVHSTWFQALTEIGWLGMACFLAMLASCARYSLQVKRKLIADNDMKGYFRAVALEAAFLGYLVAASFIDAFRSQMLYWLTMFIAAQHAIVISGNTNSSLDTAKDEELASQEPRATH